MLNIFLIYILIKTTCQKLCPEYNGICTNCLYSFLIKNCCHEIPRENPGYLNSNVFCIRLYAGTIKQHFTDHFSSNHIIDLLSIRICILNNIRLRYIFQKESYKSVTALDIIGAIVVGMALSDICMGILFKIQDYPMANYLLKVGLISTSIILIIGIIRFLKHKSIYYSFMFKRIAVICFIGLLFIIISDLTLVKIQFRNHPDYVKAYQEYKANPKTSESAKKLKMEYMRATLSETGFQVYQESMKTDTTD